MTQNSNLFHPSITLNKISLDQKNGILFSKQIFYQAFFLWFWIIFGKLNSKLKATVQNKSLVFMGWWFNEWWKYLRFYKLNKTTKLFILNTWNDYLALLQPTQNIFKLLMFPKLLFQRFITKVSFTKDCIGYDET